MPLPTPIAPQPGPPRSAGHADGLPADLSSRSDSDRLAYDPVHLSWIDVKRPDDLHHGADPFAPAADDIADTLSTAKLDLRAWTPPDLPVLHALLDDPLVWAHLPEPYPGPLDDAAARALITAAGTLPHQATRAVLQAGQPIGQLRLEWVPGAPSAMVREAELSYWLGRQHWGKGLGSAMVTGAVARAFANLPTLLRLTAKVRAENPASARLLTKAGFTRCAAPTGTRFDGWDWYALRRQHRPGAATA